MSMTKKAGPIAARHVIWSGWKLAIAVCIAFSLVAIFRLQLQYDASYPAPPYRPRYRVSHDNFSGRPKIAFLFLARRDLPLDFLWGSFFENADVANFSIYVHSSPGFVLDESSSRSKFFYGRQLSNSIQVVWGESSMIAAERLLLEAALEDPANRRFVLLSDSCVPLYNFSYVYNYLMASPRSFVDSFLDGKEHRYNPKMSPIIPKDRWRKGSQKLQKQHNCIPDEHYVQTLLAMSGLEGELDRRTLTYTQWNISATKMENKGWHPMTFSYSNATPRQIKEIKSINHIYYETEFRTEWCRSNSTFVPCFLFARKFSRGAAMRLLSEGVVGLFDATAVLSTPP
ncbi:hypothetical protein JRO89_XS06G0163400 [Xanthoceras sorbifolium]|uniref:Core-2/I-branching beta-1,6-N-acetylglucosaminyltransferase family protein n=1 Tax=Xanthoceras sorbifolium TaxID=99658 RepID=A0ABQ8HYY6_9ROSI|nr:hypothetical protein JRO89_XS06G0163400 [Xanthoceras sorbifolium]